MSAVVAAAAAAAAAAAVGVVVVVFVVVVVVVVVDVAQGGDHLGGDHLCLGEDRSQIPGLPAKIQGTQLQQVQLHGPLGILGACD